ncbi:MAG: flagellar basal body-associated FliL family protein [Peptococcaceae bacterium]|nr:flagellar basal body-associated FliL family protein [Peptococcaceae bacterium]
MKIRFNKKILLFVGVFVIGAGLGVGGMIAKEKFFPSADAKVVYVDKKSETIGPLIELKEFLVNLDGGGMVKTEIAIEGVNAKSEEKIKAKEIFLRDRIISVLSSKKISDVRSSQGRENMKTELVAKLNEVCKDEVKDVLFKSFMYSQ